MTRAHLGIFRMKGKTRNGLVDGKIWDLYSLLYTSVLSLRTPTMHTEWYWHAKDGDQSGKHQAAVGRAKAINDFQQTGAKDFEYA